MLEHRRALKGISPVLSILLMIAIAVAASLVAYAAFMGYINFQTKQISKAIQVQSVAQDSAGHVIIYVQNIGQGSVRFDPLGCLYVDRKLESCTIDPANTPLNEGQTAILISNDPVVAETTINVKVVITDGAFAEAATPVKNPPVASVVTVTSSPSGSGFVKVDGTSIVTPHTFAWPLGSIHKLEALSPSSPGTRYTWIGWSDGEEQTHNYTATTSLDNVTANFKTEYYLTVSDGGHGSASGEGWYDAGASAPFSITPKTVQGQAGTQYVFTTWSSSGAGSYSGPQMSSAVTMNNPISETANWKTQYYLKVDSPRGTTDGTGWYDAGSFVAFSITPTTVSGGTGVQYVFTGWNGIGSGSITGPARSYSVTMNNAINETASWKTQYYLTVNSPYGTVGGAGWYDDGTNSQATISPLTVAGPVGTQYLFLRWSGDATGTTSPSGNIIMDGSKTATANWKTQFQVTFAANPTGWGNTNPPPGSSNWYDSGTSGVSISATANSGHRFTSWNAPALITISNPSASSTTATINGPGTITAAFILATQSITITSNPVTGSGFVTVDGTPQSAPYTATWVVGSSHTITAISPVSRGTGVQLVWTGWSGGGAQTHTYVVPSSDATVTANYKAQCYLTVSSTRDSPAPVSGWFDSGTSITASVTSPADQSGGTRYRCTGWTGTGNVPTSGSGTSTTFTISSASSITWNWVTQCQVTFNVAPSGGGTTTPSGNNWYDIGSSIPISAIPSGYFNFISWSSPGSVLILNPSSRSTTATINGPGTVTANFKVPTTMGWPSGDGPYNINLGDNEDIAGILYVTGNPWWTSGINGIPVTFVFTAPSGTQYQVAVVTGHGPSWFPIYDGSFETSFVPESPGTWSVYAQFSGDSTYSASRTSTTTFFVSQTAEITINSSPSTGQGYIIVDGTSQNTPYTATWVVGSSHTIAANSPVAVGTGVQLVWTGWSDGGAQTHTYVVPSSDATITANYKTQYQVTFGASPSNYGSTIPSGTNWYDAGTTIQIRATPNQNRNFVSWSNTGSITFGNRNSASTTARIDGSGTATAGFSN